PSIDCRVDRGVRASRGQRLERPSGTSAISGRNRHRPPEPRFGSGALDARATAGAGDAAVAGRDALPLRCPDLRRPHDCGGPPAAFRYVQLPTCLFLELTGRVDWSPEGNDVLM